MALKECIVNRAKSAQVRHREMFLKTHCSIQIDDQIRIREMVRFRTEPDSQGCFLLVCENIA